MDEFWVVCVHSMRTNLLPARPEGSDVIGRQLWHRVINIAPVHASMSMQLTIVLRYSPIFRQSYTNPECDHIAVSFRQSFPWTN